MIFTNMIITEIKFSYCQKNSQTWKYFGVYQFPFRIPNSEASVQSPYILLRPLIYHPLWHWGPGNREKQRIRKIWQICSQWPFWYLGKLSISDGEKKSKKDWWSSWNTQLSWKISERLEIHRKMRGLCESARWVTRLRCLLRRRPTHK